MPSKLPYFDLLLEKLDQGNQALDLAFGRHVHWGYWKDTASADRSPEDFARAAEALAQKVWKAALLKEGMSVLDAGCGFGGTLASLNENFENLRLVGLNIDPRQIERAQAKVQPKAQNQIQFVEGDACAMPLPDESFDAVLAVECIFHFPSRKKFFAESSRVLKPGGLLALCDFVPRSLLLPIVQSKSFNRRLESLFGSCQMTHRLSDYRRIARETGFISLLEEDISRNTLPTYPFMRSLEKEWLDVATGNAVGSYAGEWLTRLNWLRYMILSFQKIN